MSDVHVLRRALRWDLTTPTFSSRAAVAEMKVRLDETTRVPEVVAHWRGLTIGKTFSKGKYHLEFSTIHDYHVKNKRYSP